MKLPPEGALRPHVHVLISGTRGRYVIWQVALHFAGVITQDDPGDSGIITGSL